VRFALLNRQHSPSNLEIGVGVTSFGLLFLFLGVVMFFDAALLALGDVGPHLCREVSAQGCLTGSLSGRHHLRHWATKGALEQKAQSASLIKDRPFISSLARTSFEGPSAF
jgi:hypothetical protein